MQSITLDLKDRSYPILIGRNILSQAGRQIKNSNISAQHIVVITQKNILKLHGKKLIQSLQKEGFEVSVFAPPFTNNSEKDKSWSVFESLIKFISLCDGKNKSLMLLALGGGVVGDITGFAASIYRRGIPYAQIPSTLTAQVDSAIGGKTGIDIPQGKNLLGAIYQPKFVLSDISLLKTLPSRHQSDGFAEVIKYGLIADASFYEMLEKQGIRGMLSSDKILEKCVSICASIKAGVVEKDELDKKGVRLVLNFGHTAGHAIEAAASYNGKYTHGEAVGIGMLIAADIAKTLGHLKQKDYSRRLEDVLKKFNLPTRYQSLSTEKILSALGYDKKAEAGVNRFILPIRIGETTIVKNIPQLVIQESILRYRA